MTPSTPTETSETKETEHLPGPAEYVFSKDGETLYTLKVTRESDIWLLKLDPESVK